MMMKTFLQFSSRGAIIVAIACAVCSCGSGSTDENKANDSIPAQDTTPVHSADKSFYAVPSPIQLGQLLQRAGATYNAKLLSDVANVSKYSTTNSKAINLGVYGADLSYSAVFNKSQETMSYLDASKNLADDLGISGSFSEDAMKRMKDNNGKKDSLINIISELFTNSNEALKENDQSNVSVLVLVGGFVEGLYIGTQVSKSVKNNKAIISRIAEMKGSLNNLIMLVSTCNQSDVSDIVGDLRGIKAVYSEMAVEASAPVVKADTTKNKMTIGGKANYNLSAEQMEKLSSLVEAMRAKLIKP